MMNGKFPAWQMTYPHQKGHRLATPGTLMEKTDAPTAQC